MKREEPTRMRSRFSCMKCTMWLRRAEPSKVVGDFEAGRLVPEKEGVGIRLPGSSPSALPSNETLNRRGVARQLQDHSITVTAIRNIFSCRTGIKMVTLKWLTGGLRVIEVEGSLVQKGRENSGERDVCSPHLRHGTSIVSDFRLESSLTGTEKT